MSDWYDVFNQSLSVIKIEQVADTNTDAPYALGAQADRRTAFLKFLNQNPETKAWQGFMRGFDKKLAKAIENGLDCDVALAFYWSVIAHFESRAVKQAIA